MSSITWFERRMSSGHPILLKVTNMVLEKLWALFKLFFYYFSNLLHIFRTVPCLCPAEKAKAIRCTIDLFFLFMFERIEANRSLDLPELSVCGIVARQAIVTQGRPFVCKLIIPCRLATRCVCVCWYPTVYCTVLSNFKKSITIYILIMN